MGKVLVVGCKSYYDPHESFGAYTADVSLLTKKNHGIDLVVFIGGADVDPKIYGHEKFKYTSCSPEADKRDEYAFRLAQKAGIPCTGICRGGQYLIAKAGGFLIQHVSGHGRAHTMTTSEGETFLVTSLHHQMFGWPLPKDAVLHGWSSEKIGKKAFDSFNAYSKSLGYNKWCSEVEHPYEPNHIEPDFEPEVVYLPNINSLAVQYHPEMMMETTPGYKYYVKMVGNLINGAIKEMAA